MSHPVPRRLAAASAVAAVAALAFAGVLVVASPATAATFTVTSTADDGGAGTLRARLTEANDSDGPDIIELAVTGTIELTGAPLVISDGVSIVGPGAADLTLTRDGAFDLVRIEIAADVPAEQRDVTISGLTFDGTTGNDGYGVYAQGTPVPVGELTLDAVRFTEFQSASAGAVFTEAVGVGLAVIDSVFDANTVSSGSGAAINADGLPALTITGSRFEENSALFAGGAVLSGAIMTAVTGSTFEDNHSANNRGGALAGEGTWTVTDSTFLDNTAAIAGGAIGVIDTGKLAISGSTFTGNTAVEGGAIFVWDVLAGETFSVTGSTFTDNESTVGAGGAIGVTLVDDGGVVSVSTSEFTDNVTETNGALWIDLLQGALTVDASTFAGNTADAGSGIQIEDATFSEGITITQSTFDEPGAAIAVDRLGTNGGGTEFRLAHSTVVGDTGIYVDDNSGITDIDHSIVQGTGGYDVFVDDANPLALAATWSLFAHAHDPDFVADAGDNLFATDPQLGTLAANGGPTRTLLPAASSPAIDAGNPGIAGAPAFDQRGTGFARIVNGRVDLGAVEREAVAGPSGPTLAAAGASVNPAIPIGAALVVIAGVVALVIARRRAV